MVTFDTNTSVFTALTTVPGFPSGQAVTGTFLDGYFIVSTTTLRLGCSTV
jgi:hypothetical protein